MISYIVNAIYKHHTYCTNTTCTKNCQIRSSEYVKEHSIKCCLPIYFRHFKCIV
jgi:hypothetical protein